MSVTETATDNGKPGQKTSGLNLSAEDIEELRQLDAAVNRIRKQIPETPYIVTVPCAEPRYHHPSRERAESWCKDTPFTPDEERLQYMSFMYREPGTDCFVLRTEMDEERDRRRFYGINSGTNTPMQSTGPKKKISFGAYKNRKANASPAKLAGNDDGAENKDQAQVNGHKAESQQLADVPKLEIPRGQKRPLNEAADNKPPHTKSDEESPPPAKKPRLSPSPPAQNTSDPSAPSHSTPHGLPPMLSPTGIPNTHGLPPLLSPTLPANIEAELERIDQARKAGRTVTPVSDKKALPSARPASASAKNSGSKSSGNDAPQKGVARVVKKEDPLSPSIRKSEAQKPAPTPSVKSASQPAEAKPKRLTTNGDAPRPSKLSPSPAPPPQKEGVVDKLIVKLKYGRKNRMLVKQILKLPQGKIRVQNAKELTEADKREAKPRTKEAASASSPEGGAKSSKDALKKVAEKPAGATARPATGEKRPRPPDEAATDAPAAKRQKPPSALDLDKKPSTPAQPAIPSPALSNWSSAQKAQHLAPLQQHSSSQHLTPKKDHRIALIHSASNESLDATTTPKQAAGNTPSASQSTSNNPGPTSAPSGKAAEIQLLLSRSRSLNELGRRIKHATTAILSKTSPASPRTAATATMDAERNSPPSPPSSAS
ncbi:hypothetical protein H2199_005049 [Coniosporium tulheliwenetii]|uniref:Uncharacterized protein n=1 Tax=Coniosporium tulheliwenetii TaxID=3383036 RepID=A0ACC2Z2I6_9PEZI|nr:hypothetical protein H2199_005049 [Cladosporium sp. JES 115]